jgi:hypothetical protein
MRSLAFVTIPAAALLIASGCTAPAQTASPAPSGSATPVADGAKAGAETAADKAKEGAEKIGEAAKDLAQEAKEKGGPAAHDAAEKAKEAGKEAGHFIDAEKQALDVRTALMADKTVDASNISVSADAGTKTVTLKGSVATAQQKSDAERIAHEKAGGYSVRNLLTVDAAVPKK